LNLPMASSTAGGIAMLGLGGDRPHHGTMAEAFAATAAESQEGWSSG